MNRTIKLTVPDKKRQDYPRPSINALELKFPILIETAVGEKLLEWKQKNNSACNLMQGFAEGMEWLKLPEEGLSQISELKNFQEEIRNSTFQTIVLLGMGESTFSTELLDESLDRPNDFPDFQVLDSTHPSQIRTLELKLNLRRTLFIVASKSDETLESKLFAEYFYDQLSNLLGEKEAGEHFIAIADPGSVLEKKAKERGYLKIFYSKPSKVRRFSTLSAYGLIPSAAIGINIGELLQQAQAMKYSCSAETPAEKNPAVLLGVALGTLAMQGRDKVTLITSPEVWGLPIWLQHLLAESTGKQGKGLIPIVEEKLDHPSVYSEDRVFVYFRVRGSSDQDLELKIQALINEGFPVVIIHLEGCGTLGQEFFRWEMATLVAAEILEVNPFDQPDVTESVQETQKLLLTYEDCGSLPPEDILFEQAGIKLLADPKNSQELKNLCNGEESLESYLSAHLSRLKDSDYFAILTFLEMNRIHENGLDQIRHWVRNTKRVATCLDFGPRYLYSTGQIYKGGADKGVFLVVTSDLILDILIPGHRYSFGIVDSTQVRGDLRILSQRNRKVLRVHFGKDIVRGLRRLDSAIRFASINVS